MIINSFKQANIIKCQCDAEYIGRISWWVEVMIHRGKIDNLHMLVNSFGSAIAE